MLNRTQSRAGRAILGWSQATLAQQAHLSTSTVRDFEAGRRVPTHNNLAAMRRALEEAGVELFNDDRPGARLGQGVRP
jgi:ribosome-binding protein aMBF1 (putative translation factor)